MIVLDTNIVSEPLRHAPAASVLGWLNQQASRSLFLSAVTIRELEFGARSLPEGMRRARLVESIRRLCDEEFRERVLPFDTAAALTYGRTVPVARSAGRTVSESDGMIAAIAMSNNFGVATRDTSPFLWMGVCKVVNPWNGRTWTLVDRGAAKPTHGAYSFVLND